MNLDPDFLREALLLYLLIILCLTVHEWAHAWTAWKLGDDTAHRLGRVTLNPLAHMDLVWTVIIPLVNILILQGSFFLLGGGKPVPVNVGNFPPRTRRRDDLLVTLAGPFSNLLLALAGAILGGLLVRVTDGSKELIDLIARFMFINVGLLVFNLLPIPPLDGSHVLRHAIGMREETYLRLSQYSFLFLIIAINVPAFRDFLGTLMDAVAFPLLSLFVIIASIG